MVKALILLLVLVGLAFTTNIEKTESMCFEKKVKQSISHLGPVVEKMLVNQVVNTTVNTTHLVPVIEEESHFCWNWSFSCTKKVTRYVTQWRTETVGQMPKIS